MKVGLAWGGGAGSVLALDALLAAGREVVLLHGRVPPADPRFVAPDVVAEQAAALGLPLAWAEDAAAPTLAEAAARAGCAAVAFGQQRGEEHDAYGLSRVLHARGLQGLLPIKHLPDALRTFAESGHRAFVRMVRPPFDAAMLGRFVDEALVDEVESRAGRRGWAALATFAVAGPRFARTARVAAGEARPAGDAWRLELQPLGC